MCFKRNFRENNNKNNKKIKPLWILFMRYTVETKFRLHNSPHKKIALRCCLTGETLVKLVLISSSGLNSMLSSPDVHKMIFWTTDHILAVVTEIKQSMNYFNGEREVGRQRLFGFGQVFLVCSRPESSPPHSIAAREKKLVVPKGFEKWRLKPKCTGEKVTNSFALSRASL